ncbi:Nitric-oxide synthase [Alicyclobacillus hesperidum URH17-3-68]|nr:Nitric-oxide synthase [Alicyclobacillus hesperidum URH17-3-68]
MVVKVRASFVYVESKQALVPFADAEELWREKARQVIEPLVRRKLTSEAGVERR